MLCKERVGGWDGCRVSFAVTGFKGAEVEPFIW